MYRDLPIAIHFCPRNMINNSWTRFQLDSSSFAEREPEDRHLMLHSVLILCLNIVPYKVPLSPKCYQCHKMTNLTVEMRVDVSTIKIIIISLCRKQCMKIMCKKYKCCGGGELPYSLVHFDPPPSTTKQVEIRLLCFINILQTQLTFQQVRKLVAMERKEKRVRGGRILITQNQYGH